MSNELKNTENEQKRIIEGGSKFEFLVLKVIHDLKHFRRYEVRFFFALI